MVIVLLVCSIASLVLGIMLFNQREVIKGRTQRLEEAAAAIANSLHYPDLDRQRLMDYEQMQTELDRLNAHAGVTWQDLMDTKQDLENTRLDLEQTREELQMTQDQLADARRRIAELEEDLRQRTAELAQANNEIDQLERDNSALEGQIADLEDQVARMEQEQLELQEEIADQQALIEEYEAELFEDDSVIGTPPGLMGEIVVVNEDWNFVVLDVGKEDGLSLNTEMLVHRDAELIGRVRVSAVKDQYAVADILRDWQETPLEEGDHVLF